MQSTFAFHEQSPFSNPCGIFHGYEPPKASFDELRDANGALRPAWKEVAGHFSAGGAAAMRSRRDVAVRLLREHGVTYNVYADGQSAERPWELDLLPLILEAGEWERLSAGLIQRTQLLNLVLSDLYGPQTLIGERLLPHGVIDANPGFLRPCHRSLSPEAKFLTFHAIDLTRAPDGSWWVIADRTQSPSGIGYALENRAIISRIFSGELLQAHASRLAPFFALQKAGFHALAPWSTAPGIVILTPGPCTETYFEHAYLARYLGYPLVEGSDLTVRDRCVYLKTIEGLQRVDVIIRRLDDTFCDPLELRGDSCLGVPGLIEAARAGNVAISNALGSGAVEAPAILAFLPALSKRLLGEKLLIPNVATWWCGQTKEMEYTLDKLPSMVLKRAFVGGSGDPVFPQTLSPTALQTLADRIRSCPYEYVAQELVSLSTAPAWTGDRMEARPLILRCYVAATPNGFTVMPGGLTRVSPSPDSSVVTSSHGGGSKDTWVISALPSENRQGAEPTSAPVELNRGTRLVASRFVDNLFWLGRYVERLEDTTRLMRPILSRLAGEGGEEGEMAAMTRCLIRLKKLPVGLSPEGSREDLLEGLTKLVFDPTAAGTLRSLLDRIGNLTSSVRDRFSGDTWRILRQLQTGFPDEPQVATADGLLATLHLLVFQLAAFSGMEMESMTRGYSWRFLEFGRRLERAKNICHTIHSILEEESMVVSAALQPLLEYCDSTMTYRRRYFARPELGPVLDLLLSEPGNPRSLSFQFTAMSRHLANLPGSDPTRPERVKFSETESLLWDADMFHLGLAAEAGDPKPLSALLTSMVNGCLETSELFTEHYFSHVVAVAT